MKRLYKSALSGVITASAGLVMIIIFAAFHLDERWDLSLLFLIRGERVAPKDVIIVSIDEASSHELDLSNDPKEWPRSYHAQLTDILSAGGASVVVYDLFFNDQRLPPEDELFAQSIDRAQNVVLSTYLKKENVRDEKGRVAKQLHTEKHIMPIGDLAEAAASVACFPLPRESSSVSQYWTFKQGAGNIPTLPVAAFQIFSLHIYEDFIALLNKYSHLPLVNIPEQRKDLGRTVSINSVIQSVRNIFKSQPSISKEMLNDLHNSDVEGKSLLVALIKMYASGESRFLNFYGPPRTIRTIPYSKLLQNSGTDAAEHDFRGKAVFIGLSETMWSEKERDVHHTVFSQSGGFDIGGVEIAATAFSNILEDMHVRPLRLGKQLVLVFLWGFILGIFFERSVSDVFTVRETAVVVISSLIIGAGYSLIVEYRFGSSGIWYPLVVPLLQIPLAFIAAVICGHIYCERTGCGVYLFTDVQNFVGFSENRTPETVKSIMRRYYRLIARIVERYNGEIESVPGDAMLARWEGSESHSTSLKLKKQACLAALEIIEEMQMFTPSGEDPLHTRIGMHFGRTSRGRIGSRHQRKIATFGDTVNTAQRIEAMNKSLGTDILLSEEVLTGNNGVLTREVGRFVPSGKTVPVSLYELLCLSKDAEAKQHDICRSFSETLEVFRKREWDEAAAKFTSIIDRYGPDGPSLYYLKLCNQYKTDPPDDSWRGEVRMHEK